MGDVVEGEMIQIKFSLRYQGSITIIMYFIGQFQKTL